MSNGEIKHRMKIESIKSLNPFTKPLKPENGVFEFEVSQRDFESYKANPQYGDNAMRDINKQLSGSLELGSILDLLTEETQGEFVLKSIKPQIKTFTEYTDGKIMGEMVTKMVRGAAKELGKDPKKVCLLYSAGIIWN